MENKKDEISLVELYVSFKSTITFLWQKKISIAIVGFIGAALGLTYAIMTPIKYNAKLSFIVEQESASGLAAFSGIASNFGFSSLGGEKGLYDNQVNLINYFQSRSVIEEALLYKLPGTKQSFATKFSDLQGWSKEWAEDPNLKFVNLNKTEKLTLQEDSILFEIYTRILEDELLKVSVPDNDGSIIQINYLSESQEMAISFTETLLAVVAKNYLADKTKLARQNVDILQYQTDSVRQVLNDALSESASATDRVFGLNPAYAVEKVPAGKKQVDIQMSSAVLQELVKNLEMAKVRLLDQTPLIEVIDHPKYPLEIVKNGKIGSIIKFGFITVFLFVIVLLIIRMMKKLHKAAMEQ